MNNLYHKVAVASGGIALSFTLGANKEARAATFTFESTRSYLVIDRNQDGVIDFNTGDYATDQPSGRYTGVRLSQDYKEELGEYRTSYQFNIAKLFLDSNTGKIKSAYFQTRATGAQYFGRYTNLQAYGHREGHPLFDEGEYLDSVNFRYIADISRDKIATFNVLPFIINQRIENNDSFWLGIRPDQRAFVTLSNEASLTIITEPVPEPTTIFGSAIGLCLGGWLKRKKSASQNKAKSQG